MNGDASHADLGGGPVLGVDRDRLHGIESPTVFGAVDDLAYDGVLAVQMRMLGVRDEELGLVGIGTGIGASDYAPAVELERGADLIRKWLAPYGLAALACASGIASLDHERLDVAVPLDIVVRAGCTVAEEVFGRSRSGLAEDLDLNKYRKQFEELDQATYD